MSGSKLGIAAVATLGFSQLDIKLDAIGAPGCALLADIVISSVALTDALENLAPWQSTMTWGIPADPALAGAKLQLQLLGVKPAANKLGVVTTPGAEAMKSWKLFRVIGAFSTHSLS